MGQNCVPQRWSQILVWFQSYFLILCKENVAFTRVKWLYSSCLSISKDCVNSTANVLFSDKDLSFCPFPERKFGKRNYFCFTENSILGSKVFFFIEFFCISVWWASGCLLTDCCHLVWSKTVKLQMCPRTWENMGIVLQKAAVGLEAIWY